MDVVDAVKIVHHDSQSLSDSHLRVRGDHFEGHLTRRPSTDEKALVLEVNRGREILTACREARNVCHRTFVGSLLAGASFFT